MRKEVGFRAQCRTLLFHQPTQYHMVVRSKACEKKRWDLEYSTEPSYDLSHQSTQYHTVARSKACEERGGVYSSVQNPLFHQLAQYHMVVRSKACEERGGVYRAAQNRHQLAVLQGGQVENL